MTLWQLLVLLIAVALVIWLAVPFLQEPYKSITAGVGFIVLICIMAVGMLLAWDTLKKP